MAVGLFGTAKDFFDAIYQYPGGWLADRLGRRRAFLVFIGLASLGYMIYMLSPSWPFVFVGLAFVMAWSSMASPAIFAIIGDALPKNRRVSALPSSPRPSRTATPHKRQLLAPSRLGACPQTGFSATGSH